MPPMATVLTGTAASSVATQSPQNGCSRLARSHRRAKGDSPHFAGASITDQKEVWRPKRDPLPPHLRDQRQPPEDKQSRVPITPSESPGSRPGDGTALEASIVATFRVAFKTDLHRCRRNQKKSGRTNPK